jgi:hypothetical protein
MYLHEDTISTLFHQVDKAFAEWKSEPLSAEKKQNYEDSKIMLDNIISEYKAQLGSKAH